MKQRNNSEHPVIHAWVYATTVMFLSAYKMFHVNIIGLIVAENYNDWLFFKFIWFKSPI